MYKEIDEIAKFYDINIDGAGCIWYLRTRSRWTKQLETKLVQMARENKSMPNMNEWPE